MLPSEVTEHIALVPASPFLLPHLRTLHSTIAMSCLAPNYFISPDWFRKLKTSFHDVPNKKRHRLGGIVKYLHRQNILFQYWETRADSTTHITVTCTVTSGKAQSQQSQALTCLILRPKGVSSQ